MGLCRHLFLIFPLALLPLAQADSIPGNRHVILFGIDGCRADALKLAVDNGSAPNIAALIQTGAVTWNAYAGGELGTATQQPTVSGPGWSSVLTGVWHDKHGVTDNSFRGSRYAESPTFFDVLHDAQPDASLVSFVSWPPLHEHPLLHAGETHACTLHTYPEEADPSIEQGLIEETVCSLRQGNPEVLFCYQVGVDLAGHSKGFSPEVPEYMAAIHLADERIGEVLAAIRARPGFFRENWLYIVAADHGGNGTRHGGQTPEERTIPLIVSGGETPRGLISSAMVPQTCVPATIFRHLRLQTTQGWEPNAFPPIAAQ